MQCSNLCKTLFSTLALFVLKCTSNGFCYKEYCNMNNFKPLQDRVLIERIEQDTKTSGGIIIPDTAKEKPSEGVVVAVGPGCVCSKTGELCAMQLKVGDRVLFGKWSGNEVKIEGKDYIIMKESDVMGVFC